MLTADVSKTTDPRRKQTNNDALPLILWAIKYISPEQWRLYTILHRLDFDLSSLSKFPVVFPFYFIEV